MLALLLSTVTVLPPTGHAPEDPTVLGLKKGELAQYVSFTNPFEDDSDRLFRGRVYDAITFHPLSGREVLALDHRTDLGRPLRLGSSITRHDGVYALILPDLDLEDVSLSLIDTARAPMTTLLPDEEDLGIPLFPAHTLRGRVVDLNGTPIAGAQLRVIAEGEIGTVSEAQTGPSGTFSLSAPPADSWMTYVFAAGFGSRDVPFETLRMLAQRDGWVEIVLLPRPPLEVVLVDEYGEEPGPGWLRVDGLRSFGLREGRARVTSGFAERVLDVEVTYEDSNEQQTSLTETVRVPTGLVLPLRPDALDYDPFWYDEAVEEEHSTVQVKLAFDPVLAEERGEPEIHILHADGWRAEGPGEHTLPLGELTIAIGAPFTGWVERITKAELTQSGLTLSLSAEPEPQINLLEPSGSRWLAVRAGEDSIDVQHDGDPLFVPPGVPLTILRATLGGELRRRDVAPIHEDLTLSLTGNQCIARAALDLSPREWRRNRVRVEFQDDRGKPVPITSWSVQPQFWDRHEGPASLNTVMPKNQAEEVGVLDIELPASLPFLISLSSDDFPTTWTSLRTVRDSENLIVEAHRPAVLTVRGNAESLALGATLTELDGEPYELELVPGPLEFSIKHLNGKWIAIDMHLEPGEARTLTVR